MTEKIDPATFWATILVCQEGQSSAIFQQGFDRRCAAGFREQVLASERSKAIDKVMDEPVIERASDGGGADTKNPGYEPCEFKIAEVSGDENLRTLIQADLEDRFTVGDQKVLVPVFAVDFSGGVRDFADHQE